MFRHTMFLLVGLCLSMIQTSSAHKFNKHVELKAVKKDFKGINQASLSYLNALLGKANMKEFVHENFPSKITKSSFKEESEKKYTNKLSFLLSDTQLFYTELSVPFSTDIKSFGFQETMYLNTPIVDKYNKLAGEIDLSADCQVRNLTIIPSSLGLLGAGQHGFCQVSLTYTAKDSVKSSITFAFAVTSNSLANSLDSLFNDGFVNKVFRSVSVDGIYYGKTFEFKVGVIPVADDDDAKVSFYVTEKKAGKSSQFDGRALSTKYYPPVNFLLNTSNSVAEDWVKYGIQVPPSMGDAIQYHTNYPFYDATGKFVGILLITEHQRLSEPDGPERILEQDIYTYVLNDVQSSSISFIVAFQSLSVSTYRQLSFAADGVFSGKVFDITLTLTDNGSEYITFTEVKNSKSLSYSGVAEEIEVTRGLKKGDDDYKQVVVTNPPFSVTWNNPTDKFEMYAFPGWDIKNPPTGTFPDLWYPDGNTARQVTFYTTMEVTNQTTWEVMGYIIGVHNCQPSLGGNGIDFTCQSTISYLAKDVLDSSITFVTSLHAQIENDVMYVTNTDKVVPSLSASGVFFGKTYNVRYQSLISYVEQATDDYVEQATDDPEAFMVRILSSNFMSLTFTEVRNGKVVAYKPNKQPVFKPIMKPNSKISNDKKTKSSGTVGLFSTGNKQSVGAIVGATACAILLLVIGLLIRAYFRNMKKLELKITPVYLE